MWLTTGNTLVLFASLFAFFWIPQVPPDMLERAREEKAIEIAGMTDCKLIDVLRLWIQVIVTERVPFLTRWAFE
jgi:hypothetical protein